MQNGQNLLCQCPDSAFYPTDPKIVSEDANTMSKSQQLTETTKAIYKTFTFFDFNFFRSADKIDGDDAIVHLVLLPLKPPPPAT